MVLSGGVDSDSTPVLASAIQPSSYTASLIHATAGLLSRICIHWKSVQKCRSISQRTAWRMRTSRPWNTSGYLDKAKTSRNQTLAFFNTSAHLPYKHLGEMNADYCTASWLAVLCSFTSAVDTYCRYVYRNRIASIQSPERPSSQCLKHDNRHQKSYVQNGIIWTPCGDNIECGRFE